MDAAIEQTIMVLVYQGRSLDPCSWGHPWSVAWGTWGETLRGPKSSAWGQSRSVMFRYNVVNHKQFWAVLLSVRWEAGTGR